MDPSAFFLRAIWRGALAVGYTGCQVHSHLGTLAVRRIHFGGALDKRQAIVYTNCITQGDTVGGETDIGSGRR